MKQAANRKNRSDGHIIKAKLKRHYVMHSWLLYRCLKFIYKMPGSSLKKSCAVFIPLMPEGVEHI